MCAPGFQGINLKNPKNSSYYSGKKLVMADLLKVVYFESMLVTTVFQTK